MKVKSNFAKYIFIIFIIGIIILVAYKLNEEKKNTTDEEQTNVVKEDDIGKEIKLGIAEFDTMNPLLSKNKQVQEITKIIYEPLFQLTSDYKLEKCLAKDWAKTAENKYLIKIDTSIKWSDGNNLSVDDVIFTIENLSKIDSIYLENIRHITEINRVDDNTIRLILDQEVPFFEYNLIFPILSKRNYEGQDFIYGSSNNAPIGTGKYKITQNSSDSIILEKNENYKRAELTLEKITISKYSNVGEMYNSFKLGKIDLITTNNIGIENYIGTIGYAKKEMKGREHIFLALNNTSNFLSRKEIRKAISYSIDKTNIVSNIFNNKYFTSSFPLDYGSWIYQEQDASAGYNPDQAKKILIDGGWSYKSNYWQKIENYKTQRLQLNLAVKASDSTRVTVAQNIAAQLENQGIHVNIVQLSDDQYYNSINAKNYDMILCSINLSLTPDVTTFFGDNNIANYQNDEVRSIMEEVKNTTDENTLVNKYKRLAEIYKEDVPYISLYNNKFTVAYNTGLKGDVTPNWYNVFYHIADWYK